MEEQDFNNPEQNLVPEPEPPPDLTSTPDFSKKKWVWLGIVITILNPVFAGLILGAAFLSEPKLKRAGLIISAIAIIWGAISFYLMQRYYKISFL